MNAPNSPDAREHGFPFHWGQVVRFVGGKYNGLQGLVRWSGVELCQVEIDWEGKKVEVLEEARHLQDFQTWKTSKSETELALKNTGGI